MLNADELGEKGEAKFKELCADAKLTCNKSDRDRTGWDFLVEFPFVPPDEAISLETRPPALACHVQVKTIRVKNDRIKLRLSSAERLAKELKPSFVYVPRVDDALRFVDAYLIHIFDEPLACILKSLREAAQLGDTAGNKRTISMKPTKLGTAVAPTGQDLRTALLNACGSDMFAYGRQKEQQLLRLGFGPSPLVLELHLPPPRLGELVDASLGLRAELRVNALRGVETRFGISRPVLSHSGPVTLPFPEPVPIDMCTITARSNRVSKAVTFKADMYVPRILNLPKDQFKTRLSTPFFTILVYDDHYTFQSHEVSEATPSQWLDFFELTQLYANGKGTIQLSPTAFSTLAINVEETWFGRPDSDQQPVIDILQKLIEIMKVVGLEESSQTRLESITVQASNIECAYRLLHPTPDLPLFELAGVDEDWSAKTSDEGDVLVVSYIRVLDALIGYFATATLIRNPGTRAWSQKKVTLLGMEKMKSTPSDYDNFVMCAKRETNVPEDVVTPF